MKNIAVIVGSLRKASWNKMLAKALIALAPSSLKLEIINLSELSIYNQDLDDNNEPPPSWVAFRNKIRPMDGVLFVTPEYNRSIPGVLKNVIDIGSRPYGQSVWGKKAAAVISSSPGAIGGFGANQHLRQTFVCLDLLCMQQPEAYISDISNLFDDKGHIANKKTEEFLTSFMKSYEAWVNTIQGIS